MADLGEPLSERELAVLERLVEGDTNREIAHRLNISHNTVKVHVRNIFAKLGVSTRTEAATLALQNGLVPSQEPETPEQEIPETQVEQTPEAQTAAELPSQPEARSQQTPHWRTIAFILLFITILLFGLLAGVQFLGGDRGDGNENTIPAAEGIADEPIGDTRWFTGRQMPQERSNMALAAVGLDLYQIGGEVEAGVVNLVDVFQTDSGEWRSAAPKPTAVSDAEAAVLFGEIIVPGGGLADNQPTSVVEAYSPANNAWRPITPLPNPVAGGLTLSDGNKLYLIGGWDGENYLADAIFYDPEEESWQALPPMKQERAAAAGGLLGDRLFVVGGYDGQENLSVCEYFDISENAWSDCENMSSPRAGAGAAVLGNHLLYVIGGGLTGEIPYGEVFDEGEGEWKRFELPMLDEAQVWVDLGVANVETRIFALGGRQTDQIISDSYVYMPLIHQTFLPAVGRND